MKRQIKQLTQNRDATQTLRDLGYRALQENNDFSLDERNRLTQALHEMDQTIDQLNQDLVHITTGYEAIRPGLQLQRQARRHFYAMLLFFAVGTGAWCQTHRDTEYKQACAMLSIATNLFSIYHGRRCATYYTKLREFVKNHTK
ncbi:hypothetical protein HDR63_04370 [bacterium]|nr:hypothetical protein [bacterium]